VNKKVRIELLLSSLLGDEWVTRFSVPDATALGIVRVRVSIHFVVVILLLSSFQNESKSSHAFELGI